MATKPKKRVTVTMRLPSDWKKALKKKAGELGTSDANAVGFMLGQWVPEART